MVLQGERLRISPRFILSQRFWSGKRKEKFVSYGDSYIAGVLYRQHFHVCGHSIEFTLSRKPTKFTHISFTFPQRGLVINPCIFSINTEIPKFALYNDFLFLELRRRSSILCSEVIRQSQVTFLLLSEFSIFSIFSQTCYIQVIQVIYKVLGG
jgi:hypothetical protein